MKKNIITGLLFTILPILTQAQYVNPLELKIKKQFNLELPKFSNGHTVQSLKIAIGDINGDFKEDAVIQCIFNPTNKDLEENGKASLYDNDNIFVYINEGGIFKQVQKIGTSEILTYATMEFDDYSTLNKISDGKILFDKPLNREEKNLPYNKAIEDPTIIISYFTMFINNKIQPINLPE